MRIRFVSQYSEGTMDEFVICPNPNCQYRGPGKKVGGSNGCLILVLLCLGILPGLLYLMLCEKKGVACPQCGMRIR